MTACSKPSTSAMGVSSRDLQKARRIAKRRRASVACNRCKAAKTKCSDYRPCKQCSMSKAAQSCVQRSPIQSNSPSEMPPVFRDSEFDASRATRSVQQLNIGNIVNQPSRNFTSTYSSEETLSTIPQALRTTQLSTPGSFISIDFLPPTPFHQAFSASTNSHLHHPIPAPPSKTATSSWIQYAPLLHPVDIHHLLAAQAQLLSSRIGLPPLRPTLPPLPPPPMSPPLPLSAGLLPAIAALLGHGDAPGSPAALPPDALRCLLHAAAARGQGTRPVEPSPQRGGGGWT
jgi:hypothetical protein